MAQRRDAAWGRVWFVVAGVVGRRARVTVTRSRAKRPDDHENQTRRHRTL